MIMTNTIHYWKKVLLQDNYVIMLQKMTTKLIALASIALCMVSCEGSRTRRLYDSGKSAYDDYEKTGDATGLIIFILGLLVVGGLWLWNKSKDK